MKTRRGLRRSRCYRDAGFSLVELTFVVTITLVVAAIAIPNVVSAVSSLRLTSSVEGTASLLQDMRMRAVSDDRHYTMLQGTIGQVTMQYADLNADGTFNASEPSVQLDAGVVPSGVDIPPIGSMALDFTPQAVGTQMSFSARGVPCVVSGFSCKTTWSGNTVGFAYFFSGRVKGTTTWAAVTVSPSGRIKTWNWTGTSWKQR